MTDNKYHSRLQQEQIEFEQYCSSIAATKEALLNEAIDAVYKAAEDLAPYLKLVYHQGDGKGGWILSVLREAAGISAEQASSTKNKRSITGKIRRFVMERDFYRCKFCGTHEALSIDHIVPRAAGGGDEIENLQTLCLSCNIKKGSKENYNEQ